MVEELTEDMYAAAMWGYQIVRSTQEVLGVTVVTLAIHEVHRDADGEITGITENPAVVLSENIDGLRWALDRMRECLDRPVLNEAVKEFNND